METTTPESGTPVTRAPSVQTMPTPAPKRRMHPAVIGVIVVGVLAGGYLAYAYLTDSGPFAPAEPMASESPSPSAMGDPTAGWKTYRNEKYGVEFKYPADGWFVSEDGGPISVFGGTPSDNIQAGTDAQVWMSIAKDICNDPTNDFVLSEQGPPLNVFEKTICSNGFQITLGLYANNPDTAESKQILEMVAATVRSVFDTSAWKTYNSPTLGISFDYDPKRYEDPQETGEGVSVPNYYESPPSIEGGLYISLLNPVPTDYIDQEATRIRANAECQIVSEQPVQGARTLWYKCSGKGEGEEVLIRHPYRDGVLRIQTLFSGPAELVGSLKFTK